jgi:hypothetical protein
MMARLNAINARQSYRSRVDHSAACNAAIMCVAVEVACVAFRAVKTTVTNGSPHNLHLLAVKKTGESMSELLGLFFEASVDALGAANNVCRGIQTEI